MGILAIIYYGKPRDVPPTGWRFFVHYWSFKIYATIAFASLGMYCTNETVSIDEVDYSKYLGPNWKKTHFTGKRVSM